MGILMQSLMALCMSTPCTFVTDTVPMIIIACTTSKTYNGQQQVVRSSAGKDLLIIKHLDCKAS